MSEHFIYMITHVLGNIYSTVCTHCTLSMLNLKRHWQWLMPAQHITSKKSVAFKCCHTAFFILNVTDTDWTFVYFFLPRGLVSPLPWDFYIITQRSCSASWDAGFEPVNSGALPISHHQHRRNIFLFNRWGILTFYLTQFDNRPGLTRRDVIHEAIQVANIADLVRDGMID